MVILTGNKGIPSGDGQYILVWKYRGRIWGETYKLEDGDWYQYVDEEDDYVTTVFPIHLDPIVLSNIDELVKERI